MFGGFSGELKSITPNTAIDHEAEVSFLMECVDPNTRLIDDVWVSLESDASDDDDSVVSFSKAT